MNFTDEYRYKLMNFVYIKIEFLPKKEDIIQKTNEKYFVTEPTGSYVLQGAKSVIPIDQAVSEKSVNITVVLERIGLG